jgi:predicted AAA+ superfamily ATPase
VGAGRRHRLPLLVDSLTGYLKSLGHRVPKPAVAATIVTRHEQERIRTGSGSIEVVPIWRFLLDS